MGDTNSNTPNTRVDRLNSFHPECNDLKQQYDECFNVWFTEHYMNGHYNNEECQKIFGMYTDCVKRGMKEYGLQYDQSSTSPFEARKEKSAPTEAETSK